MSSIKPLRSLWLLRPVQLLFGAFFLQFLLPCALAAQGVSPSLPAVFRRVGSVDELVDGGYYVLMGETAVGRCVLMSHSLDGNRKLEGLRLVQVDSLTVEIEVNHEDDLPPVDTTPIPDPVPDPDPTPDPDPGNDTEPDTDTTPDTDPEPESDTDTEPDTVAPGESAPITQPEATDTGTQSSGKKGCASALSASLCVLLFPALAVLICKKKR